jgi:hypothetical protein
VCVCVCLCCLEIWGFLRVLEKWQALLLGWSSQWRFHCLLPSCSRCCTSSINNLPSSCLLCLCGSIQGTHVTVFMGVFSFFKDLNAICLASVLVLTVSSLEVFFLQKTGISVFLGLRRFSPSAVVCSESSVEHFCKVWLLGFSEVRRPLPVNNGSFSSGYHWNLRPLLYLIALCVNAGKRQCQLL